MTVEGLKTAFDWIAVILLFLTFAAGAGVLVTGNIINSRQEEKLRTFDSDLTNAKSSLAAQQQRAADAEGRLEALRGDNLKLQSDLLKLRKEGEPRRLTGEQKDRLRRLLETHPTPIAIVSRIVDTESSDFADDFATALHEAHWESSRIRNRISSKYGVSVGTVGANSASEVRLLSDALTSIGVPNEVVSFAADDASTSPHFQEHVLYLVIEQHPPLDTTSVDKR